MIAILLLAAVRLPAASATSAEGMIRASYVIRDGVAACKAAEDFCYSSSPAWMKEGKAYKAKLLTLTRAPRSLTGKKINGGEIVWIVLVENLAESDLVPTPRTLVCVKASDGAVVELVPNEKPANKAPEPTPTAVTPRAGARVAPAAVVAHL
jgi:hypothetical protein